MMDERERENDATFQDHNTHTHIQRGPKWNSDDPPTIPHFLSSVWVWSRYTMVGIVLVVQWIDRSHHTSHVNFGVELPPAKKIQWLIQYTFYLPCTCRCGNHRILERDDDVVALLIVWWVKPRMNLVHCVCIYIYINVTISFVRFEYIYIPYINQSKQNEPTTNKYGTIRYARCRCYINHLR